MMHLQLVSTLGDGNGFFQTDFWAAFKENGGWRSYKFHGIYEGLEFKVLLLTRPLFCGLRLAYCPYGPTIDLPQSHWQSFLSRLSFELQAFIPLTVFFIRYDLPWLVELRPCLSAPLRQSAVRIQPRATIIQDLSLSAEQLLANMHKKWRYNIRLSERRGVKIESAPEKLTEWYRLYQITAARDQIGIHHFSYYHELFDIAAQFPAQIQLDLLLASHDRKLLAGIIIAHAGRQTIYLYGASANEGREHMPNYLLQWQAMLNAKKQGSTSYDFFGIPETAASNHPMAGLYRFKVGFGGQICQRMGVCDYPRSKVLFSLFRGVEQGRSLYQRWRKKRA